MHYQINEESRVKSSSERLKLTITIIHRQSPIKCAQLTEATLHRPLVPSAHPSSGEEVPIALAKSSVTSWKATFVATMASTSCRAGQTGMVSLCLERPSSFHISFLAFSVCQGIPVLSRRSGQCLPVTKRGDEV